MLVKVANSASVWLMPQLFSGMWNVTLQRIIAKLAEIQIGAFFEECLFQQSKMLMH